jgi:ankyrin repeat protein
MVPPSFTGTLARRRYHEEQKKIARQSASERNQKEQNENAQVIAHYLAARNATGDGGQDNCNNLHEYISGVKWSNSTNKYIDIASSLIDNGADLNCVNTNGMTPLMNAILKYNIKHSILSIAKKLITLGADLNIIRTHGTLGKHETALDMINKTINEYTTLGNNTSRDIPPDLLLVKGLIMKKGGKTAKEIKQGGGTRRKRLSRRVTRRR